MAADLKSVFTFLKVSEVPETIELGLVENLRSAYDTILKTASVTTTTTNLDDQLKQLAQMFLLMDDATNLEHLKLCVTTRSVAIACAELFGKYADMVAAERRNARRAAQPSTTQPSTTQPSTTQFSATQPSAVTRKSESLSHIICEILVKQNKPAVIEFIQNFLLFPLAQTASTHSNNDK
jgi:hypothetical protein